jgi:hypothetical protein
VSAEIFGVNGFAAQSFSAWYRDVSVSGNGVTAETMIIIGFSVVLNVLQKSVCLHFSKTCCHVFSVCQDLNIYMG